MPVITKRPNSTISNGSWTKTPSGGTVHGILSDDNDGTYISTTTRAQLPSQFAIVDIADVTIPDGAKIFSVRVRVRVLQTDAGGGGLGSNGGINFVGQIVEEVLEDTGLGIIGSLLAFIFGFACPRPPHGGSATWETVELAYYPTKPSGGEWTVDALNDMQWRIGRSDNNGQTAKVSEYYVDIDYNERPTVLVTGPLATRTVTDGATTNTSTTFTSATAAFQDADEGASIVGAGIPANTTILTVNSSTNVTLSAAATATASGVTATISGIKIATTTRPTIPWTYGDPEGDPQAAFRVKVFNQAQYSDPAFDVDVSTPFAQVDWTAGQDTQWRLNRDLPNDSYRAFVQVKQVWTGIGDHVSEWDSYDFEMDVEGPPVPLITATPNANGNWIQIDLQPSDDDPVTETYNVEYSDNAGISWQLVRGGFQVPVDAGGLATLFDYEAPLNIARWYRAQAYRTLDTVKVASDLSDEVSATIKSYKYWLKDPLNPSLNTEIVLSAFNQGGGGGSSVQIPGASGDQPTKSRAQGVFAPLVAEGYTAYKIVVNGPQYGIDGVLTPQFLNDALWNAFMTIIESGRTLLYQKPTGENIYVGMGGELAWSYLPQGKGVRLRVATISYTEVVKPADPGAPTS